MIIKSFLFLLSLIYGFLVRVLSLFYGIKPYHLKCKVISVGNITLGGTGKTALVELICSYLKQRGHKAAILSRGYKKPKDTRLKPSSNYETMGDEPFMLQQNLRDVPVIVDSNRIQSARLAMRNYNVDTVVLDDGFQQWQLKKDLDIVMFNTHQGLGNQRLLPRGILRQPLSSLKRAGIFVLTNTGLDSYVASERPLKILSPRPDYAKLAGFFRRVFHPLRCSLSNGVNLGNLRSFPFCGIPPDKRLLSGIIRVIINRFFQSFVYCQQTKEILSKINPGAEIFEAVYNPLGFYKIDRQEELLGTERLKGKTVALVCGIANPDSFKNTITKLGMTIGLSFVFSDHHHYSRKDWERIALESEAKFINTIVTTQKDAARLSSLDLYRYNLNIYVLRVELRIKDNEERFYHRLLGIYSV